MPDWESQREKEILPYPDLAPVVWCFLKQTTTPRNWCLQVACSPWLDYVSILFALISSLTLGMYDPCKENNADLQVIYDLVFAFFVVEMIIKMVALGVFGHNQSYLSNNWNKFDFFIICGESFEYFLAFLGFDLMVFHFIRTMRLVGRVPSMRTLVLSLLDTMPMFLNVLILYMLVIHTFGVLGVQQWKGELRNRCFLGEDISAKYNVSLSPYYQTYDDDRKPFICSPNHKHGMKFCHDIPHYSLNGNTCSSPASLPALTGATASNCINWNVFYNVCHPAETNPYMGASNFDTIGYSWIMIFQVVTLEGWTEIMFSIMDANSFWNIITFLIITVVGAFIMMNMCGVVIATQFSKCRRKRSTEEQSTHLISFARVFGHLTSWVNQLFGGCNRCKKVFSSHKRENHNILLTQVLLPIKRLLRKIVKSKLFDRAVMLAVLLSVLTVALEHHDQPVEMTYVLSKCNKVFTFIFLLEMLMKLFVYTYKYFMDRNNVFDFFIVIMSFWDLSTQSDSRLSILRVFRLLRFVRLLNFLPYVKQQLFILKRTIARAASFFLLLLFAIFICSALGMYLFGCKFPFRTQSSGVVLDRKNFDTSLWSALTVFQILTLEDWNIVLYNTMIATSPWASLYTISIIMLGKYVLLNVLTAIVVDNFQTKHAVSPDRDSNLYSDATSSSDPTSLSHDLVTSQGSSSSNTGDSANTTSTSNSSQTENCSSSSNTALSVSTSPTSSTFESISSGKVTGNGCFNLIAKVFCWFKEHDDWSFYMFSPKNRLRVACQHVISHRMFDTVILIFILLSCVTIAMDRPTIDPDSTERSILNWAGYLFSAVFFVEMLLKVLALGLILGKGSYLRSSWNVLDGVLVILSVDQIFIDLATSGNTHTLGIFKFLRLLRALRPLRVIRKAPKLKLAVEALITSIKPIGNIVVICCIFFFFYGILGVQLFKGKFFHCKGGDMSHITNKAECLSANYNWERKHYNFDNLLQALLTLFVMFSKDGWMNIMYDGLDAMGVDQQPVMNHNLWMLLYFISFMFVSFLLLDMFIGIMVDTFHECQQEQRRKRLEARRTLKDEQKEPKQRDQIPYYEYYSPLRLSIHALCTSSYMELLVTVIILSSVFIMAIEHYNQPQYVGYIIECSYYIFTTLLIIEILLKLVAFGIQRFLKNRWNLLDVAVILGSTITIILETMKMSHTIPLNPSILRVCRILRLSHVLKIKYFRVLLKIIIKTLSQVGNISLLFMFFFFIYAVLGVELFSKIDCDSNQCTGLGQYNNFKNFGMALIVLYQVCTGDNWNWILEDTMRACYPDEAHCQRLLYWVSPLYFITFVIMAQFMLVNLVVASIMQAMEDSIKEEEMKDAVLPLQSTGEISGASSSENFEMESEMIF